MIEKDAKREGRGRKLLPDLCLVAFLICAGVLAFLMIRAFSPPGAVAVVSVNGEEVGRYSLDTDGVYPLNGGTNTLVIEGGCAYVTDADCPDKLCEKMGKISRAGEEIVCLPNRLSVRIEGKAAESDPGFVVFAETRKEGGRVA